MMATNERGKKSLTEKKSLIQLIALATISIIAIVSAVTCFSIYLNLDKLIENSVRSSTYLDEGNQMFQKWMNPKYKLETAIYTFSVKNPDAIMNGSKPILKSTGPYVFDQIHKRKLHSFANKSVEYETFSYYFFNENKSCEECYLYNRVWVPNIVFQKFVETASKPTMKAATAALLVQTPFLEIEVSELLFDGYTDPFLDQVCNLPFVNFVCESVLDLPERIGFFYEKNGTSSGTFLVNSGQENASEIGQIAEWNGKSTVPETWWSDPKLLPIRGTDGTLFQPILSKDKPLTVFVTDLCRSIDLVFKEEIEYKGLLAYRYIFSMDNLNFTQEQNQGFCNDNEKTFFKQQDKHCLPEGLLDLSRCKRGEPPIVFSLPNFLSTPKYVQESIDGLSPPDPEHDSIYLDFEPRLGALFRAFKNSQVNIAMWKGANLTLPGMDLSKFHTAIVPVIQSYESVEMDEETFELIHDQLINKESNIKMITIIGMILGTLIFLVALLILIRNRIHSAYTVSDFSSSNNAAKNATTQVSTIDRT